MVGIHTRPTQEALSQGVYLGKMEQEAEMMIQIATGIMWTGIVAAALAVIILAVGDKPTSGGARRW